MGNKISVTEYNGGDSLIAGVVVKKADVIASGEGQIVRGQTLARNYATGKLVKYVSGGTNGTGNIVAVADEAVDATSADIGIMTIIRGTLVRSGLVGMDEIVSENEMEKPDAPAVVTLSGGTLTAGTTYTYKVVATNGKGQTAPSTAAAITAANATAGYAESENAFANIAAVNTILGDCSTTNKILVLNVDGVTNTVTFNANYAGAGALANWAALITKLDVTGVTPTASDANKIKITSDTTGINSKVTIVNDTTGLFGVATVVNGAAAQKTAKITIVPVQNATGYDVYRSTDAFATVSKVKSMTADEIIDGYVTDDGSLTYTDKTAVTISDFAAYAEMNRVGFDLIDGNSGYSFRNA